jgi:hypothetical protein
MRKYFQRSASQNAADDVLWVVIAWGTAWTAHNTRIAVDRKPGPSSGTGECQLMSDLNAKKTAAQRPPFSITVLIR